MKRIFSTKKTKFILKGTSIFVTIVFLVMLFLVLGTPIYNTIWLSSQDYAFAQNILNFQSSLYILLSIICLASLFLNKLMLKIIWIITFLIIGNSFYKFPEMQRVSEIEVCEDSNYCQEEDRGWATYDECKKNKKAWNIDDKACDLSFTVETCLPSFFGNWELPEICSQTKKTQ